MIRLHVKNVCWGNQTPHYWHNLNSYFTAFETLHIVFVHKLRQQINKLKVDQYKTKYILCRLHTSGQYIKPKKKPVSQRIQYSTKQI